MTVQFGIISTGQMAALLAKSIALVSDAETLAVVSRSMENAKAFSLEHAIERSYDNDDEFFNDPDIDVVYIASPHSEHRKQILKALNAGKHVLCEKPICVNGKETKEVIQLAREKNLFLMEAMWVRFLPSLIQTRQWLGDNEIGDVYMVEAGIAFGALSRNEVNERLLLPELAGGALLDLGIYPVSFTSMVMGRKPDSIKGSAHFYKTGVDESTSMIFSYSSGALANLYCSLRTNVPNGASIYGNKGAIEIPAFWWARQPMKLLQTGKNPILIEDKAQNWFEGYAQEVKEVVQCLKRGAVESSIMPLDETLSVMETMDDVRELIGLKYPAD